MGDNKHVLPERSQAIAGASLASVFIFSDGEPKSSF